MSVIDIRVEALSKSYQINRRQQGKRYRTLQEDLLAFPRRIRGVLDRTHAGQQKGQEIFWALQDISFQVKQGEALGIIGRNGAGKSTLLKILSRITEPTAGRAEIYGRVGSLLEVGTGFHPELTGRENVYLSGAILGMRRNEIVRRFDEIVDFAEVEQFIDTPVKRYSSGMYMRLAFSVAAHLEPEILIVDEVLAVGDATFQEKCLSKMDDVAQEGRTVLFVSHNLVAIQRLCHKAILLGAGRVVCQGDTDATVSAYLSSATATLTDQVWPDMAKAPGNELIRLHRAYLESPYEETLSVITTKTPLTVGFEYWNLLPDAYLNLSVHIYNEEGVLVFNTIPLHEPVWHGRPFPPGLFRSTCAIPGNLLNDRVHRVELMVVRNQGEIIYRMEEILVFEVVDDLEGRGSWYGTWAGAVRPRLEWTTDLIKDLECP